MPLPHVCKTQGHNIESVIAQASVLRRPINAQPACNVQLIITVTRKPELSSQLCNKSIHRFLLAVHVASAKVLAREDCPLLQSALQITQTGV